MKATSALAGFHAGPLSWSNVLEFGVLFFCGKRNTGEPGETVTLGARTEPHIAKSWN